MYNIYNNYDFEFNLIKYQYEIIDEYLENRKDYFITQLEEKIEEYICFNEWFKIKYKHLEIDNFKVLKEFGINK